jgi:uncharacterized membrane protein
MTDYGIRDDFTRKLGETIPQGFSALFVRAVDAPQSHRE